MVVNTVTEAKANLSALLAPSRVNRPASCVDASIHLDHA